MSFWFLSNRSLKIAYYARGRDALWQALEFLGLQGEGIILIPSYLCSSVIQPIKTRRLKFRIYDIQRDTSVNIEDLVDKICPKTKALLVIHYFGFPQPMDEIIEICKKYSLLLIEDCAHVLMSKFNGKYLGTFGDAAIFSFKKTLTFLSGYGAALLINKDSVRFNDFQFPECDIDITNIGISRFLSRKIQYFILEFKICRYLIDKIIGFTDFMRLNPKSQISIPYLNKIKNLDIFSLVAKYRDNFMFLLDNTIGCREFIPIFKSLPSDVCPIGFPAFVSNNRDNIFRKLLKNGIRSRILWEFLPKEINKQIFKDADYISKHILILPIDDFINIKKICKIIKS